MRNKVRLEHFILSDEELQESIKGLHTPNMATNSEEFTEWMKARNKCFPNEPVPQNLLTCDNMNLLTLILALLICSGNLECEGKVPSSIHHLPATFQAF